ncbi:MAG: AbrB/MazE/SpoVT family DNA-binding domain-containing protein [Pseudomonadota bacterium]|nr:AbrB/MazE/SpoVT family DNA-binding domain-containing protein [Pseudomonadota bacterium]
MRAQIIRIGNSRGIRIPKPLLEQTGIKDEVDMMVEKDRIIISPITDPRAGWDKAFQAMNQNSDDMMIDGTDSISHPWDDEEWEWS